METPEVLCFAWSGTAKTRWSSSQAIFTLIRSTAIAIWHAVAYQLLNEADALVTFNGDHFDIPHLNLLLQMYGFPPAERLQSIDLRKTTKRAMYAYQSLDWTCQKLGLGNKLRNPGLEMWISCMKGDSEAWATMEDYDKQDVRLTDKLYVKQLPWIKQHPNAQLTDGLDELGCPRCGQAGTLIRQGVRHTKTRSYPRFQCKDCGTWSKGSRSIDSVQVSDAA